MTHFEFCKKNPPPLPYHAQHLTFEGRCLNCGYDPANETQADRDNAERRGKR